MFYLELLIVGLLGLAVGSFLNVVIFRLETQEAIINSRSKCRNCSHQLAAKDLIPLWSFISLKGRCRYCKQSISWQYPLVELASSVLFVVLAYNIFNGLVLDVFTIARWVLLVLIFSALLVIFVFDYKHFIIPDQVIFPAIALAIAYLGLAHFQGVLLYPLSNYFIAACLASGFFLFLVLVTRGRGMGMGDIKLVFLLGLMLGILPTILALFFAFIVGALVGVILIIRGKKSMNSMLPFGPFLIGGFCCSFFYGQFVINWYLTRIGWLV